MKAGVLANLTTQLVKEIGNSFESRKRIVNIPTIAQKTLKIVKPDIYQRLFGDLVIDNKVTCDTLGSKPKYSFKEGINEMVKAFLS